MREGWLRVTQMARWATTLLAARTSVATQVTVHDSIEPCPSCIPDARMWYGTQRPRLTCTRRKRLQRTPPSLAEPAGCILRVRSCPAQAQAMTSVIHQREHLRISSRRMRFSSPYSARSLSDALSRRRPLKRHRKFHPADDFALGCKQKLDRQPSFPISVSADDMVRDMRHAAVRQNAPCQSLGSDTN